jgi:hypothetical protein
MAPVGGSCSRQAMRARRLSFGRWSAVGTVLTMPAEPPGRGPAGVFIGRSPRSALTHLPVDRAGPLRRFFRIRLPEPAEHETQATRAVGHIFVVGGASGAKLWRRQRALHRIVPLADLGHDVPLQKLEAVRAVRKVLVCGAHRGGAPGNFSGRDFNRDAMSVFDPEHPACNSGDDDEVAFAGHHSVPIAWRLMRPPRHQ